jgi:hypothetical protein
MEENNLFSEIIPYNIYIMEDIISNQDCDELRKLIDSVQDNLILDNTPAHQVECFEETTHALINNDKIDEQLRIKIKSYEEKIFQALYNFCKTLRLKNTFIKIELDSGYLMRKIFGGTSLHVDSPRYLNDTANIRCLSIILALNDDFDGGVFNFPYHNFSKKLKKGSVIGFPPYWTHPHEVTTVGKNQFRYTITTWMMEKL